MADVWDFQISTQTLFTGEIKIMFKYNYTQYNKMNNFYICVSIYNHGCVRDERGTGFTMWVCLTP